MRIVLNRGFLKKLTRMVHKYEIEVGILEDKAHKRAVSGTRGEYAGGPIRRSRGNSGKTIGDISNTIRNVYDIDYLREPFKKQSSDIIKFTNTFFKYIFGKSTEKRLINLIQAIVRNPILRGDYGPNSEITKRIKGFDRALIDTGQFFKAIKARVKRV